MIRIATVNDAEQLNIFKFQFCLERAMPTTSQQVARCRGIHLCMAHCARLISGSPSKPCCKSASVGI